jgi:hypothetical protein
VQGLIIPESGSLRIFINVEKGESVVSFFSFLPRFAKGYLVFLKAHPGWRYGAS